MKDSDIIQQYKDYEPIFGSWYIKRFIGEGGFAKVFEITRNDFGDEYTSALKIITVSKTKSEIITLRSEGMTDYDIREYLRGIVEDTVSEIKLMYKLRGKGNIVSYEDHAVIEHEDGMGWDILIKMEYLTSLSNYIYKQKGRLAKRDIIRLGVDICKSLEHCQRYNIIHRDIKADNIFISDDGEFKLGDFGIARVIERKDQTLSKKGTSAYMAPEVYKGQTYTSAVDIYSLGMVMYRLMNNNRGPFLPPYPQPMSLDDRDHAMMLRMSGERFSRPSQVTRGRLVEIVLKACAYRPEERYSSPGFMRQELEAIYLDTDEMTTEEWVMIYDAEGRSKIATLSTGQSGIAEPSTPESTEATEVLREEAATEVPREERVSAPAQSMLSRAMKTCIKCRGAIDYKFMFCPICGANQHKEPEQSVRSAVPADTQTSWINNILMSDRIDQDNGIDEEDIYDYRVLDSEILREQIASITFLDSLDTMPKSAWDVSDDGSRNVMAWVLPRDDLYDLYIGGEGGVAANTDSGGLFRNYTSVEQIQFNVCFRVVKD